ncbi:MAG TPA: type II toxin-antitoxin system VapC family toxin [Burkholderiales bacterium]
MGHESVILLDTHALIWWVSGVEPLSPKARRALSDALKRGPVHASAISLLEIATAARRGRLSLGVPVEKWLDDLSALPELRLEPVSADIARHAGSLGEGVHGDPIDRIVVATARVLKLKLVTADARLRGSSEVQAIW